MESSVETHLKTLRDTLSPDELQCLASRLLIEQGRDLDDFCPVPSPTVSGENDEDRARIEFFVEHKHRSLLKLAPPAPATKYIPRWFRGMDTHYNRVTDFQTFPKELKIRQNSTVKQCPAIIDFLRTGYVLPLWCDYSITFRKDGTFSWQTPNEEFALLSHPRKQYETMPNEGFKAEVKFVSPWYCRTSPGYSIRVLPCYYHFDHLWAAMPGIVHSDQHHTTHINALFQMEEGQIILPRGTPMAYIVPFRRERYDLDIHEASAEDVDLIDEYQAVARRFISGSNGYQNVPGHFS
ncbi:MAG: hypothetical protein CMO55_00280 [Verrucomicrobiales bacterium]|nr:hypothetical protein [Verrucomicrobiales bacterium]